MASFNKRKRGSSRNRDGEDHSSRDKHHEKENGHENGRRAPRTRNSKPKADDVTTAAGSSKSKSTDIKAGSSKSAADKSKTNRSHDPPPPQQIIKNKNISSTLINYDLKFEDLGGLQDQIEEIKNSVIYKVENKKLLKKYGLNYRVGGILLEGPPGTGKTICAHTIAAELSRRTGLSYTFFTHNAVESMTKWLGESESNLRHLFRVATENSPSIIFFDEFDAICPRRDDKKSSTEHKSIVATILSEFNKIQDEDSGLVVIGATNIVDNIDPAMLRSGRFDTILNFPLPVDKQREEIIRLKMRGFLVPEHLISWLTRETDGYSGAHLTYLCHEAQLNCFKRQIDIRGDGRVLKKDNLPPELGEFINIDFFPVLEKIKIFGNESENPNYNFVSSTYSRRNNNNSKMENPRNSNNNSVVAGTTYDALIEELCKFHAEIVQGIIPKQEDLLETLLSTNNLCSQVVNSFLFWSFDSNSVLNKLIMPRMLEILKLPSFKLSDSQLKRTLRKRKSPSTSLLSSSRDRDRDRDESDDDLTDHPPPPTACVCLQSEHQKKRILEAIDDVVTEAGKVEGSSILFIENIDSLFGGITGTGDEFEVIQSLLSTINKNVILLATASCDVSKLPRHVQPLFFRLGNEKSMKLRLPTDREITKCFCQITDKYITPRINQLSSTLRQALKPSGSSSEKDNNCNWPRILKNSLKKPAPTFGEMHRLRSELILEFLTSSAETFVESMESFKL